MNEPRRPLEAGRSRKRERELSNLLATKIGVRRTDADEVVAAIRAMVREEIKQTHGR
jgi:hypothetical protein